jgi:hypothetical protein
VIAAVLVLAALCALAFWLVPPELGPGGLRYAGFELNDISFYCAGIGVDGMGRPALAVGWVRLREPRCPNCVSLVSVDSSALTVHGCRPRPWLPFLPGFARIRLP